MRSPILPTRPDSGAPREGRGERGSASVEFVLLLPVLLLVVALVAAGARIAHARALVQQVADSAARTASLARDAGAAQARAVHVAHSDLRSADLPCAGGVQVAIDTAGFAVPVGQPASVSARVRCALRLGDLVASGLPGTLTVEASAVSVLDRYRGRR